MLSNLGVQTRGDVIVRNDGVHEHYGRGAEGRFDLWNRGIRHGFDDVHATGRRRQACAGESGVGETGKRLPPASNGLRSVSMMSAATDVVRGSEVMNTAMRLDRASLASRPRPFHSWQKRT